VSQRDPRTDLGRIVKREKDVYDRKRSAEEDRLVQLGGTRKRWDTTADRGGRAGCRLQGGAGLWLPPRQPRPRLQR
jgi:hypothetical protein